MGPVLKTFLSEELGHKKTQLGFIVGKAGITQGWGKLALDVPWAVPRGSLSDSQEQWWCRHNGSSWLSACLHLELSQRFISACVYEGASREVQLGWEMGSWSEGKEKNHTEPQHSYAHHLPVHGRWSQVMSWDKSPLPWVALTRYFVIVSRRVANADGYQTPMPLTHFLLKVVCPHPSGSLLPLTWETIFYYYMTNAYRYGKGQHILSQVPWVGSSGTDC